MRVPVDRLVQRDVDAAREIVVLVAGAGGRDALEHALEVAQQEGFVLVDGEPDRRVEGLEMDAAVAEPRTADLVADPGGEVDELGGTGGCELQPRGAHRVAPRDC